MTPVHSRPSRYVVIAPNDVLRGAVSKAYVEGLPESPYVGLRTKLVAYPEAPEVSIALTRE